MSKLFKVKTRAIFNGQPVGSTIELGENSAKTYEALKYVEILSEVKPKDKPKTIPKPKPSKKVSAPKKTTKEATESKTKDK